MKQWKSILMSVMVVAVVALTASCVTETAGKSSTFKKPSKEDLDRATSLYVQMAYKYMESKDYEKAMSSVKRAMDISPDDPKVLNTLAVVYQNQGDTEKARDTFEKTLRKDSKFSEGHLNYGQFLLQQKENTAACKQFQLAADDDFYTRRATAYFYLAVCEKVSGHVEQAEFALGRCLGLDPAHALAMGMLASIKFEKKQYPEAKELFDRHVQTVRASKQALSAEALWLGIQLERVFNNKDAEASWAVQLKNNYPYSKEYLEYQKLQQK